MNSTGGEHVSIAVAPAREVSCIFFPFIQFFETRVVLRELASEFCFHAKRDGGLAENFSPYAFYLLFLSSDCKTGDDVAL